MFVAMRHASAAFSFHRIGRNVRYGSVAAARPNRASRPPFERLSKKLRDDYDQPLLAQVLGILPNALILVVDDDVFERMGASCMFSYAGYRVLEAESADEALRFFETNTDIRVLFTDVSMPGSMSGSDLAHRVAERWPGVGIIITSGRPRPEPLPLGTRFHAKPYEPTNVLKHTRDMTASLG
jgi:two-component system, response regulator PdtaR